MVPRVLSWCRVACLGASLFVSGAATASTLYTVGWPTLASPPAIYEIDLSTGTATAVHLTRPDGYEDVAGRAGDSENLWALTTAGEIVRVDLDSGTETVVFDVAPVIGATPAMLTWYHGLGFDPLDPSVAVVVLNLLDFVTIEQYGISVAVDIETGQVLAGPHDWGAWTIDDERGLDYEPNGDGPHFIAADPDPYFTLDLSTGDVQPDDVRPANATGLTFHPETAARLILHPEGPGYRVSRLNTIGDPVETLADLPFEQSIGLAFVPEPARIAMLGAGLCALTLLAAQRRSRRR